MSDKKILVIDDSPTILKVVQLVLTKAGFYVLTATDGDEGVEIAKQEHPDVILLDFVMPKMNGYQVCQALHQEEELKEIPVILMSAKGDQVGERFVKVMGIVDYITKPFSPEAITAVVQHTVDKYEGKDSLVEENTMELLPQPSPEEAAVAADAAIEARRSALSKLREGVSTAAGKAVILGAIDQAVTLEEDDVAGWIARGLSTETLELLIGELRVMAPELTWEADIVLAGELAVVPLAEVLLLLSQQEQTGLLGISKDGAQVELHFTTGKIMLGTAAGLSEELLLGRFLLENNLMSQEDLERVLSEEVDATGLLGTRLVKRGLINDSDLKEAIRQQTCELVYELLRWKTGRFAFHNIAEVTALASEAALNLTVDSILMEGFRRVDEWHLIERQIDDFEVVFLRNEDAVTQMGQGRLTREEMAILELVTGKNTVKEIVRQSRMGSFDVSKMLYRLLSIKLIRKRVPPVAV